MKLSKSEFTRLSKFIYGNFGIKMPEVKHVMLQSRLQKRLRELQFNSFKEYTDYLFSKEGQANEVIHMIDAVSTNKTDFFREVVHFEFLKDYIIPEYLAGSSYNRVFKVWSAGCASGEEPYTIAFTINDFKNGYSGFDYSIYATDISTKMLKTAIEAIYTESKIEGIPNNILRKYFLKSKDRKLPSVRVIKEIRSKIIFQRLNLMDSIYHVNNTFDAIFCRNVLIYFDRSTQEKVINRLCEKLKPDGFFFLGHSESITNFKVPLKQIKPTIFKRI